MNHHAAPAGPTRMDAQRPQNWYVDKKVLADLIREYKATGKLSDALSLLLLDMCKGVQDRYQFSPDRDDFAAECWIHLTQQAPLRKVDPDGNPFAFFTRCIITWGNRRRRRYFKMLRLSAEYRAAKAAELEGREEVLSADDVGDEAPPDLVSPEQDPDLTAGLEPAEEFAAV